MSDKNVRNFKFLMCLISSAVSECKLWCSENSHSDLISSLVKQLKRDWYTFPDIRNFNKDHKMFNLDGKNAISLFMVHIKWRTNIFCFYWDRWCVSTTCDSRTNYYLWPIIRICQHILLNSVGKFVNKRATNKLITFSAYLYSGIFCWGWRM